MGPDFVPPPNNMESSTTDQSSLPYPGQCLPHSNPLSALSPCLTNENPSVIGMNETNGYIQTLTPESFYDITTSSYCSTQTLDNMTNNLPSSSLFNYLEIDNHDNSNQAPNPDTTIIFHQVVDNEFSKQTTSQRTRKDSTESIDTVDSSSSGEIFNSTYTDTVSSTTSSAFLIKASMLDSDEETPQEEEVTVTSEPGCCNDGYMSFSSTEVLNEDSDDNDCGSGSQENLISLKTEEEEEPDMETDQMLPVPEIAMYEPTDDDNNVLDCNEIGKSLTDFMPHHLTPIRENEIVSFVVTEVEPSQYTKITDNIIVVDESFLFNSTSNLGDLELGKAGGKQRAGTMQNLHERSSFLDLTEISKVGKACQKALVYLKDDITMGSLVSLNTAVAREKNNKDPMQSLSLISGGAKLTEGVLKKTSNYTKNLVALSLSITLLYIAVGSVRNLQSSINHEGGVGVVGLAFNFVGYVVGSMFSSSIVQSFQPRKCLIANLFPNLLYIAANLYPTMWVMVPISLIQGISLAIISNATSTYITHLAKGCAQKTKETFAEISCRFFGIYSLMYISHLIIGNLIASLILQPPSSSSLTTTNGSNSTNATTILENTTDPFLTNFNNTSSSTVSSSSHLKKCGPNFCQHFEIGGGSQFSVDMETKYFLFGVYIGCLILALIIAIVFMEPLSPNLFRSTVSPIRKLKQQMSSLTRFFADIKFILLLPLLMQSVMQFAFITAEFAKGYITCALGIHMIGYTMICFGVCSSISSFMCGLLNKYIGRVPFIVTAAVLNLVCLVYMLQWLPTAESFVPYFVIMGLWGVTDGFWTAQVTSLMGIIFPDKIEEAYAGLRMTQGLSAVLMFGISSVLCMTAKIYITIGICSLGLVGYAVMEAMLRCQRNKPAVLLKQTSV